MDITLHEELYGQTFLDSKANDASSKPKLRAKKETIKNLMDYSRALSVNCYDSLGQQETILN
jgi:ribosomal protein S15P/S13E